MITALALKEVADEIGAQFHGDGTAALSTTGVGGAGCLFNRVSTDTRALAPGDLFVALRGANFDAHDFLRIAADRGAVGLVVERRDESIALPQMVVGDTVRALGRIAAIARRDFHGPLVAITGSSGKTTVKGMVASILANCGGGRVHATRGNLNNQIGVPLTLLELEREHDFAVIEMGASAAGEIAWLTGLARPTAALVNNIMPAHVEGFGSIEGVARAKGEIFSGLVRDGKAIINLDDRFAGQLQDRSREFECLTFAVTQAAGRAPSEALLESGEKTARPDFYAERVRENGDGSAAFVMHSPLGPAEISLQVMGRQNVANALAAAACGYAAGAGLADIQLGLRNFRAVSGRMHVLRGRGGAVVIDDSYNANPGSARAAIDVLSARAGEKVLVLGDMGELGAQAEQLHRELGEYAKNKSIDRLITVGSLSECAGRGFGAGAEHFSRRETAIDRLKQIIGRQTVLLVKGSRSARMELIVRAISEDGEQQ